MPLNNLPAGIQNAVQQNYLDRVFEDTLRARLGFRDIADREAIEAGIGETVTKTRLSLLPVKTTPINPAANTDLTSGLGVSEMADEQYQLTLNQYGDSMMLNVVTSRVLIASKFLQNVAKQAEQAARSIDTLARRRLFQAYASGNTYVTVALTAAGTSVKVDDIQGFAFPPTGAANSSQIPVSTANPLTVIIGQSGYTCVGATADESNTSSKAMTGGISGTLTLSSNVSTTDATVSSRVLSSLAAAVFRPNGRQSGAALTATDFMTTQSLLAAKAQLGANGVPPVEADGLYRCFGTELQFTGLYNDPLFQSFSRSNLDSVEYRKGVIAELLGVKLVDTNNIPIQTQVGGPNVYRSIVCGQGALIEGGFTETAYEGREEVGLDSEMIRIIDGIAFVIREPLDALKQVVTTSWSYIGDFCPPTDVVTNPSLLPTASNAAYKRAAVIESC